MNMHADGNRDRFEAWLLGTKGENAEEFEKLVVEAIRDTAYWRRHVFPMDPRHITEEMKESPEFRHSLVRMRQEFQSLLTYLKKSVPAFSMRYQAHMGWDLLLPGMLGYFAGMLHGPNNIAYEGGPATTVLESIAARDLCNMIGFKAAGKTVPWGHFTGGGTLSNIEGLWAARNLKFLPLAVRGTLQGMEREFGARGDIKGLEAVREAMLLETAYRRAGENLRSGIPFSELTAWELLNLEMDEALELPERIAAILEAGPAGEARYRFESALNAGDINGKGLAFLLQAGAAGGEGIGGMPVILAAGTRHFSFEKAACLLGLGQENIVNIFADEEARMDPGHLEERLKECLDRRIPVIAVIASLGTTEEGAVDPIADILALRAKYRGLGLDFAVHVDAAWGGYHASILREDFPMEPALPGSAAGPASPPPGDSRAAPARDEAATPSLGLGRYAARHYAALPGADIVAVDPHKQGHIPFPAAAICYRNSALRSMVRFSAPYLGGIVPQDIRQAEAGTDRFLGVYGVEGSRPGAAAAAVFLTHRLLRPSRSGYGRLIGMELFNSKKLFALLARFNEPGDEYIAVPLASPAGRESDCARVDALGNREIASDAGLLAAMEEMGPDLNILAYLFNFRIGDRLNQDLGLLAAFNQAVYDKVRLRPEQEYGGHKLIVSQTLLMGGKYGPRFLNGLLARLGLAFRANAENCGHINLLALRSTVANPWLTDTVGGSFLPHFRRELRAAVKQGLAEVHLIRVLMDELKRERSPLLANPMLPVTLVGFAPDLLREKLPEEFTCPDSGEDPAGGSGPCTKLVMALLRQAGAASATELSRAALNQFDEARA